MYCPRKPSGSMPAGQVLPLHSWGDTVLERYNYDSNIGRSTDVGLYSANPWGFFDMHGNVMEWTADWYGELWQWRRDRSRGSGLRARLRVVARGGSW